MYGMCDHGYYSIQAILSIMNAEQEYLCAAYQLPFATYVLRIDVSDYGNRCGQQKVYLARALDLDAQTTLHAPR